MERKMQIGKHKIMPGRAFIIAEVGSNHCQSLELALEHVRVAAECGADAVKFQCLKVNELYHDPSEEIQKLHEKIDLPEQWIVPLAELARKVGIEFLSSATYPKSIQLLRDAGVNAIKVASAQASVFPQLVRQIAKTGIPTILSTGLLDLKGLDRVVQIFHDAGNRNLVVLHCNSVYPAPPEIVHLQRMVSYRLRYGCEVGFSDHTENASAAIAAVALGASVIERHFTLSARFDSPDAPISLEPEEFRKFCGAIREAEAICGSNSRDALEPQEQAFRERIRHYLLSTKDISVGEELNDENTALMRGPGFVDAWDVFGKEALRAKVGIPAKQWIRAEELVEGDTGYVA